MLPEIDISLQDPAWGQIKDIEKLILQSAAMTLEQAILPKILDGRDLEASVVLANDDLVQVLNREYRGLDKPTNVLSFASLDDEEDSQPAGRYHLGDVILAWQTIEREAQEQGKFLMDHILHLTVHGILHLLGYDHETEVEATDMETLEIRILERLGIQNPYIDMGH